MNFIFKSITISSFARIWDSDYYDGFVDSHVVSFSDANESEWAPLFEKQKETMKEVIFENRPIGYIFLSPKEDGSAHLGYGLYRDYRGFGYSVEMCKKYLALEIPKLDSSIKKIVATSLADNIKSQRVLEKLRFKNIGRLESSEYDYIRFEKSLKGEVI